MNIQFNKYLPIVFIYFFFNGIVFNNELLLTTLLTPLLFYLTYDKNAIRLVFLSLSAIVLLFPLYKFYEADTYYYLRSVTAFSTVLVFGIATSYFCRNCHSKLYLFKKVIIFNTWLIPIALLALYIPAIKPLFWYTNPITHGISAFSRLKMLTYEPSYYATLWVPIAAYYLVASLYAGPLKLIVPLAAIALPLALSLSFGVLSTLALSLLLVLAVHHKMILNTKEKKIILLRIMLATGILALLVGIIYPQNIFYTRFYNVLTGKDISFIGRTYDSFLLAWKIASEKSIVFGAGPGQVKLVGLEIFRQYYNYDFKISEVGIPNAVGDTFATFGIAGLLLRFTLLAYFFKRTKPYKDSYRLSLFFFGFIYQFTGSFITNIAEYTIWIFAFTPNIFKNATIEK